MGRPVMPLDRRVGDLPVPAMIVGMAPVIVVFVSLAALHTFLLGSLGWAAWLYVVPLIGLGPAAALGLGSRLLPSWTLVGYPVLLVACPALLEVTEALSPLTLLVGLTMLAYVLRAPRAPTAPAVTALPGGAASGTPPAWSGAQPLGRSTGAPPVRLRLLPPRLLAVLIGAGVGSLALGACVAYAATADEVVIEGGSAARWIAAAISVACVIFGLLLLYAVVAGRRDTLEIDGSGIRRRGGAMSWSLEWTDVRAVAVGMHVRVVPDDLTPTPRRLRERRTVQLLLAPTGPRAEAQEDLERLRTGDLPEPFTHLQRLPDTTPWASRARLADVLADALERQVPDRHLVLRDVV